MTPGPYQHEPCKPGAVYDLDYFKKLSGLGRWAEPRMYTLLDAAAFFGMSTRWVRERIKARELDGFGVGRIVVSGQSMNRFLRERQL